MIYLASPYTAKCDDGEPDSSLMLARCFAAAVATAEFLRQGHFVWSPIVSSNTLEMHADLPGDWQFWQAFDQHVIGKCDALWVLKLPGWRESVGVTAEIAFAVKHHIPVSYIEPSEAVLNKLQSTLDDIRDCEKELSEAIR